MRSPETCWLTRKLMPSRKNLNTGFHRLCFVNCAKASIGGELTRGLQNKGWLKPPGANGKNYLGRRINGKYTNVYVFNQFWNSEIEQTSETSETSEHGNVDWESILNHKSVKSGADFRRLQGLQQDVMGNALKSVKSRKNSEDFTESKPENLDKEGVLVPEVSEVLEIPQKHENQKTESQVFQVGDRIQYIGTKLTQICQNKILSVGAVREGEVLLAHEDWSKTLTHWVKNSEVKRVL